MKHLRPLCCIVLFLLLASGAAAQPLLNEVRITRIDTTYYPTIRVYLRVLCNGSPIKNINPVEVSIRDGGINKNFTLTCPAETLPVSVALVCDRSGSVAGPSILMIQQGAREFVSLFTTHPSGTDEGALVSFADTASLDQPMTTDKQALYNAINALYPLGYTAMFDAAKLAIQHVADSAHNPIRAVVLLSDGYDNMSWASRTEVIWLARNNHIPIYTIGTSYEDTSYGAWNMRILADSTGGVYYPVYQPSQIVEAFNAIASLLTGGSDDCLAEYQVDCADGTMRTVTVTANACGIAVSRTQSYRTKLDPTLPKFTLRAAPVVAYTDGRARIPILIRAESPGTTVQDLQFRIPLNPLLTDAQWITAPYFARYFSTNNYATSAAAWFSMSGSQFLDTEDTLCLLDLAVGSVQKDSLIPLPLLDIVRNIDGCQIPVYIDGSLLLRVRPALAVQCGDSITVRYDAGSGRYAPDTVALTVAVRNSGAVTAGNVSARILLPPDLELIDGPPVRLLSPPLLAAGQSAAGTFLTRVVPSDSARTLLVCIETFSDSSRITRCCTRIDVAGAKPKLSLSCSAPAEIRWDDLKREFSPNPFAVSARVLNRSVLAAANVTAWIDLPQEFILDPSTPAIQTVSPPVLGMSDTGAVQWLVRALERETSDTVSLCLKVAAGGDTAVCCIPVYVTASPIRIAMSCAAPAVVSYDDRTKEFTPSQFTVSTVVRNTSLLPMSHMQAQLTLSGTYGLANGETPVKYPPGQLLQSGDSVRLSWNVIAVRDPEADSALACVRISADNFPGAQCCSVVRLRRLNSAPVLTCGLAGPDTVRFVDRGYVPNPVTIDLTAGNTGTFAAMKVAAALLQGADISIDSNDVALKQIADSLAPGGSAQASFRLRILPRGVARFDTIRVTVYALNGGSVVCEKIVWIEAVRNPLLALACTAPDSILFDDSLAAYTPAPFTLSLAVRNDGGVEAANVTAEFLAASGLNLAAGEQAVKPVQPSRLAPGQSGQVSWLVEAAPHAAASVDTMRIRVTADGGFAGAVSSCATTTAVQALRAPRIRLQCAIPVQPAVAGNGYQPDPLAVEATLTNSGTADGFFLSAELQKGARYTLAPNDSARRIVPRLGTGGSLPLRWMIRLSPSTSADTQLVCVRLTDRNGGTSDCCANLYLPPIGTPDLRIACAPADTLWPDPGTGEYQNPLVVRAVIDNPSAVTLDTVRVTAMPSAGLSFDAGEPADKYLYALPPQGTRQLDWRLRALADTGAAPRLATVRFTANIPSGGVECVHTVLLMPRPDIRFTASCDAPDTIRYAGATAGLQPDPFAAGVTLYNTGSATLAAAGATILLPPELTLVAGEQPTKYLSQPLAPGGSALLSWNVHPSLQTADKTVACAFSVQNPLAPAQACTTLIFIEGIREEIQLRIPVGNIVRATQSIPVPVYLSQSAPVSLPSLEFTVGYDPSLVAIAGCAQAGTLTESWDKISLTGAGPGTVRIRGAGPLPIQSNGIFCYLVVRGLDGGGANPFAIGLSPLHVLDPAARSGVRVSTSDGDVTVSGLCLSPLLAGENYVLHQNKPNPFNPRTEIAFDVAQDREGAFVTLVVHDLFHRPVATLFQGPAEKGLHTISFDASAIPSGVYFYSLMTTEGAITRKMLLAK